MSFWGDDGADTLVLDNPRSREPEPRPARRRRWLLVVSAVRTDLVAAACYLAGALWVTAHLWVHPNGRVLAGSPGEQYQFEYWLAHAARVLTAGENPFYDHHVNAPMGINLMANPSCLGLTVPLAPVTILCGPAVAFALIVVLAPAGTAVAWYWLLSRHFVGSRVAALVGGAVCGFAPGLVSQTDAHPDVATQALVPLLLWWTTRLARDTRYLRNGAILGALAAYQALINEEVLLITALGALVYCTVWAVCRPAEARACAWRFLAGLGTAAGLGLVILAYPLWWQFFGPLAGGPRALALATSATEQNANFGWALAALAVVLTVALWREVAARAAVVTGLVLAFFSLGTHLRVNGVNVSKWGPWRPLVHLPVFDAVIPARLSLALIPVIGLLVAVALDRVGRYGPLAGRLDLRLIAAGGTVAALLPLVPVPLPAVNRPVAPRFISSGLWRSYVPAGRSLVSIPLTGPSGALAMRWSANQRIGFTIAGGYFLVPDPATPGYPGMYGAPPRPTAELWSEAAGGRTITVVPADRARAAQDLAYWRAGAVMLVPQPHATALRALTTSLLGFAPRYIGGAWVWDVARR